MVALGPNGQPQIYFGEKFLPLFEPYRHKAYFGGRGSGKSHAFAEALALITSKKTKRVVCGRQFQNSIKDSVKELLEQKMRAFGMVGKGGYKIYDREIVHEGNESRYSFIGLDRNPDSAKSLEGADICWIEEARTVNRRSMEIIIPTIRTPGSEVWWSWNPEFETDPVDEYFRSPKSLELTEKFADIPGAGRLVVAVDYNDNPYFYQTPLAQEMEYMRLGNEARYKHIWLGAYDDAYDTKIFSDIEIGRILVPEHIPARYGMDFGFGGDPFFMVKLYIIEAAKTIYIAREATGHVPLRELPTHMLTVLDDPSDYVKADSADPGSIDHLNSNGFNLDGAKKGPGSVRTGINWLQGYHIVIDPECQEMREAARMYTWQVDKLTKKKLNVPVHTFSHAWDACRYACEDHILNEAADDDDGEAGLMKVKGF